MDREHSVTIGEIALEEAALPQTTSIEAEKCTLETDGNRLLEEQIRDLIHYRDLRKLYASRVFYFMCIWSALVFAIVIFRAFNADDFILSDIVLTTLIGGTTVSVIGLVGFMMQGLFHSKKN